jgi:hypothetical protein
MTYRVSLPAIVEMVEADSPDEAAFIFWQLVEDLPEVEPVANMDPGKRHSAARLSSGLTGL